MTVAALIVAAALLYGCGILVGATGNEEYEHRANGMAAILAVAAVLVSIVSEVA